DAVRATTASSGARAVFVTKLSADGRQVLYSALIGGRNTGNSNNLDSGQGIAVNAGGEAFITGTRTTVNFPVTTGALRPPNYNFGPGRTGNMAFVAKLRADGRNLILSAIIGPNSEGTAIAVVWVG